MQKAIFNMNMQSNGQTLSDRQVDNALRNEMMGMRGDMSKLGKEIKKLASRPINVNNKVEIPDLKPY